MTWGDIMEKDSSVKQTDFQLKYKELIAAIHAMDGDNQQKVDECKSYLLSFLEENLESPQ